VTVERDAGLIELEARVCLAVRDAVNRRSRKPFHWGGLAGYHQLEAIAQALKQVSQEAETEYFSRLAMQVNRALEKNRPLAQDVGEAHAWLRQVARCLRYPLSSSREAKASEGPVSSRQVRSEMEELWQQFRPDLKRQPAQAALYHAWHRLWESWGPHLLHCYDVPGLPADNLQLEGLFGKLRCRQRRISGRRSTRPLREFGQYQVLFDAQSEEELLHQLRQVPLKDYRTHRRWLAQAEIPRQETIRLHRNPLDTMNGWLAQHAARRKALDPSTTKRLPCGNTS